MLHTIDICTNIRCICLYRVKYTKDFSVVICYKKMSTDELVNVVSPHVFFFNILLYLFLLHLCLILFILISRRKEYIS